MMSPRLKQFFTIENYYNSQSLFQNVWMYQYGDYRIIHLKFLYGWLSIVPASYLGVSDRLKWRSVAQRVRQRRAELGRHSA